MTEMYARADNQDYRGPKDRAPNSYTLFVKGYPYSFGKVYLTDDGRFNLSLGGRSDRGWPGVYDPRTEPFNTIAEALSYARQQYEGAMGRYHTMCARVMEGINQGLSKIEKYDDRYSDDLKIVLWIGLPNHENTSGQFNIVLNIQEAITALDYLYDRLGATASIRGMIFSELQDEYKTSFAEWTIPAGSNDYHLAGHRSLEGVGRYGSK